MREDVGEDTGVALRVAPDLRRVLAVGDQDAVHHDVGDGDGERAGNGDLAQEAEGLGEVEVLGGVALIADRAAQQAGDHGQARGGVADGEGVVTGDLLHERPHEVGRHHHVEGGEDAREHDQLDAREAGVHARRDEHEREPVQHVAREEDGLELGEARHEHVDGEADQHDDADLGAVLGADVHGLRRHRLRHNRVKRRGNAVDGVARNESGTGGQHKEANGRHDGAAHDLREGLLLEDQADAGDECQEDGALPKDLVNNEVEHSHGGSPLSLRSY